MLVDCGLRVVVGDGVVCCFPKLFGLEYLGLRWCIGGMGYDC